MAVDLKGDVRPTGRVELKVIRPQIAIPATAGRPSQGRRLGLRHVIETAFPHRGLRPDVSAWRRENAPRLLKAAAKVAMGNALGLSMIVPALYLTKIARCDRCRERTLEICARMKEGPLPDQADFPVCPDCDVVPLGLASLKLMTTAGVNYIVDAFIDSPSGNNVELFDFHAIGTGSTAEAVGDTALVTELTTQYNPDNTRATGTPSEGATANIYRSVGTNTVDATAAIVEHMLTTQAATGGGTCFDRSVFSVVNLASGDSLQTTYEATFSSGG
jgi:hypothetical protein